MTGPVTGPVTTPTPPGGTSRPGNRRMIAIVGALSVAVALFTVAQNRANPRAVWYCTITPASTGAPQDSALVDTATMTTLVVFDRATGAPRLTRAVDSTFTPDSVSTITISAPCASLAPDTTTAH